MATIQVTYRKSAIGYNQRQKDTIRSLGLRRLGQTIDLPDNGAIRGMVHHVKHLVVVEEVPEAGVGPHPPSAASPSGRPTSGGNPELA